MTVPTEPVVRPWLPGDPARVRRTLREAAALTGRELGRDPFRTLRALGRDRLREDATSTLAHVLSRAERVGRWELVAALYEFGRACQREDAAYAFAAHIRFYTPPSKSRDVGLVLEELERRSAREVRDIVAIPGTNDPREHGAAAAARIIRSLVGTSLQGLLLEAHCAFREKDALRAVALLEEALPWVQRSHPGAIRYVQAYVLLGLLRSGQDARGVDYGERVMNDHADDRGIAYNTLCCYSALGDTNGFASTGARFRALRCADENYWHDLLVRDKPVFAAELKVSAEEVDRSLDER